MKVYLDMRETALFGVLTALPDMSGVPVELKALDVGDLAITTDLSGAEQMACVLERKSADDLGSSLTDGRYREQRARLLAQRGTGTAIGYLLEIPSIPARGWCQGRFTQKDLRTAVLRLQLRYTIPVIQTSSLQDSAAYVAALVKSLTADPLVFRSGLATTAAAAANVYTEAIHVKKADNSSPDRIFRSLLRVVPGLGPVAVEAIAAHCKSSFPALFALTKEELAALSTGKRKLGAPMAEKLYNVFHS
jgi:ERCC4-type nuclease